MDSRLEFIFKAWIFYGVTQAILTALVLFLSKTAKKTAAMHKKLLALSLILPVAVWISGNVLFPTSLPKSLSNLIELPLLVGLMFIGNIYFLLRPNAKPLNWIALMIFIPIIIAVCMPPLQE